jgi:hypothetical protein
MVLLTGPMTTPGLYKKIIDMAAKSAGEDGYRGLTEETLPIVFRSGTNSLYHSASL